MNSTFEIAAPRSLIKHFVPYSSNFSFTDAIERFNTTRALQLYTSIFDWFYSWDGKVNPKNNFTDIYNGIELLQRNDLVSEAKLNSFLSVQQKIDSANRSFDQSRFKIMTSGATAAQYSDALTKIAFAELAYRNASAAELFQYNQSTDLFASQQAAAARARNNLAVFNPITT